MEVGRGSAEELTNEPRERWSIGCEEQLCVTFMGRVMKDTERVLDPVAEEHLPQLETATDSDQEVSSLCVERDGDYLSFFDLDGIQTRRDRLGFDVRARP